MSDFPSSIYAPRTKANKAGVVYDPSIADQCYAEDVAFLDAEVVAIEETLGTEVQGSFDTVELRLDDVDSSISALQSGKQDTLGFTAENVANKSTTLSADQTSNTKYPSVKSVYDWATGLFQTALGYTAENTANKSTSVSGDQTSNTKYPSVKSVFDWATATFQAALGFTAENVANKDTDGTLGSNSDTKYPSQKAVKTYVDAHASTPEWTLQTTLSFSNETSKSATSLPVHDLYKIVLNLHNLASSGSGTRLSVWLQMNGITTGYQNTWLQSNAIVQSGTQESNRLSDSGGDGYDINVGEYIISGRHNNGLKMISGRLSGHFLGNVLFNGSLASDSNDLTRIDIAHSNNSFGNGAGMTGKVDIYYKDL